MRDAQVYRMHEANTRRVLMLLDQFEFMNARMMAMEHVLFDRKMLWRSLWNPQWAKRVIDNKTKDLLARAKAAMEAAKQKTVIKPVVFGGNHGK